MLSTSLNRDGVRILLFEGNILLFNARQLAIELIYLLSLFNIELEVKGLEAGCKAILSRCSIGAICIICVLIEHPKQWERIYSKRSVGRVTCCVP
jgi:hypothetical protein